MGALSCGVHGGSGGQSLPALLPFASGLVPHGEGVKAPTGSITEAALAAEMTRYRREVAKRDRVVELAQAERVCAGDALFIPAKLDGELWLWVKRGGATALAGCVSVASLPYGERWD